jgi:(1->4)-alpha-D-glucan 1-alpha-D-glucosylmutase
MLYQALIGAWPEDGVTPEFAERMKIYAIKAAREGKQETSWTNPNEEYEKGLTRFIERLLDRSESSDFLHEFGAIAKRTTLLGALNGLSQLALKATMPGVPDFYQGTELWDFSLVDPDNRRAVDFEARAATLPRINDLDLRSEKHSGEVKFALTRRLLAVRAKWPALFAGGRYVPVDIDGEHSDHVIAFVRALGRDAIIVAVGRHFAPLTEGGRHWPRDNAITATLKLEGFKVVSDALNGKSLDASGALPLGDLFNGVPVAILTAVAVGGQGDG